AQRPARQPTEPLLGFGLNIGAGIERVVFEDSHTHRLGIGQHWPSPMIDLYVRRAERNAMARQNFLNSGDTWFVLIAPVSAYRSNMGILHAAKARETSLVKERRPVI